MNEFLFLFIIIWVQVRVCTVGTHPHRKFYKKMIQMLWCLKKRDVVTVGGVLEMEANVNCGILNR